MPSMNLNKDLVVCKLCGGFVYEGLWDTHLEMHKLLVAVHTKDVQDVMSHITVKSIIGEE